MQRKIPHVRVTALAAQNSSHAANRFFDRNNLCIFFMKPVSTPPGAVPRTSAIVSKIKEGYLVWVSLAAHIPKASRYTIGSRIKHKFLTLLETSYLAYFTEKERKPQKVTECVLICDTLKLLVQTAWEAKLIAHENYAKIASSLDEVGRMLGGWRNKLAALDTKNRTL